jgi:hypothetical protein
MDGESSLPVRLKERNAKEGDEKKSGREHGPLGADAKGVERGVGRTQNFMNTVYKYTTDKEALLPRLPTTYVRST